MAAHATPLPSLSLPPSLPLREAEREAEIEEAKKHIVPPREIEMKQLLSLLSPMGLNILEVAADGHCLYRSVAHQVYRTFPLSSLPPSLPYPLMNRPLRVVRRRSSHVPTHPPLVPSLHSSPTLPPQLTTHGRPPLNYQAVRRAAAQHMRDHPDDFLPFLAGGGEEGGEEGGKEGGLEAYVRRVEETAEWGGELEIRALVRGGREEGREGGREGGRNGEGNFSA